MILPCDCRLIWEELLFFFFCPNFQNISLHDQNKRDCDNLCYSEHNQKTEQVSRDESNDYYYYFYFYTLPLKKMSCGSLVFGCHSLEK